MYCIYCGTEIEGLSYSPGIQKFSGVCPNHSYLEIEIPIVLDREVPSDEFETDNDSVDIPSVGTVTIDPEEEYCPFCGEDVIVFDAVKNRHDIGVYRIVCDEHGYYEFNVDCESVRHE